MCFLVSISPLFPCQLPPHIGKGRGVGRTIIDWKFPVVVVVVVEVVVVVGVGDVP